MPYTPWPVFANLPQGTVTSGGTSAPAAGTVETWTVNVTVAFPATFTGATQVHIADIAAGYNTEILIVTVCPGATGLQTWTVTRGAENTTPVTHLANFTITQVVSAGDLGAIQNNPWQFPVEQYGAVCDGKIIADVVLNSTTTITSATANFVTGAAPVGDVGKYIMINGGAGTTSPPLITTIASVTNATTAVLANAASVTGSPFVAIYGTDDTAAINTAMTAAGTYALANGFFAEVLFGAKYHILASGPTQTTSPAIYNAQIPVPYPDTVGSGRKLVIVLTGTGDGGYPQYYESTTPNIAGSALISMTTAPGTMSPTYGNQSVIGGPGSTGFTGGFANVKVHCRGLTVVCPAYTNQWAYDFSYIACMRVERCSAHIFAPTGAFVAGKEPQLATIFPTAAFINCLGAGLVSPVAQNNAEVIVDDFTSQGYTNAYQVADHFTASRMAGMYTSHLLVIDTARGGSSLQFPVTVQQLDAEAYDSLVWVQGGSSGNVPVYLWIASEYSGVANGTSELNDPGSALFGEIHWTYPTGNYPPQVTGGTNVKFINDSYGAGIWTGAMTPAVPAAPASGTAQQNIVYRDATLYLNATTITAVYVGPASASLTTALPGQVQGSGGMGVALRVPSGFWFKATYTGTLTTTWILE